MAKHSSATPLITLCHHMQHALIPSQAAGPEYIHAHAARNARCSHHQTPDALLGGPLKGLPLPRQHQIVHAKACTMPTRARTAEMHATKQSKHKQHHRCQPGAKRPCCCAHTQHPHPIPAKHTTNQQAQNPGPILILRSWIRHNHGLTAGETRVHNADG
jgi:hypothetical protein